jgi:hypothetical protein
MAAERRGGSCHRHPTAEKFIVPAELDGTHGLYRRPQMQCLLNATNDYQAILAWLRSKHGLRD